MYRKTDSFLLPMETTEAHAGEYNIYPAFDIGGEIYSDIAILAKNLISASIVIIDGYEGVLWKKFTASLSDAINKISDKNVRFISIEETLKSEQDIDFLIEPFMGKQDSIFGRMATLQLIDFFDRDKLSEIKPDTDYDINIIYGCGASLAQWNGTLIYVDLPKNELQFRMAAGVAFNIGTNRYMDERESYKRCYFIDWPVLDKYKGNLIPRIDWILDEQRIDSYTFMTGYSFRNAMEAMCSDSFRLRPWFAPGIWGGTYMRDNINGLNRNASNFAWSYELMALENGVLLRHNKTIMEVSFCFLMSFGYREILGHCAEDFKEDFPIRFDFLDTIKGGNLSIQCHPRPEYIRSQFGKLYTQDETYYILKAEKDACVYLGFQDGVLFEEFAADIENSRHTGDKLDVKKYLQCFDSKIHDFFLIPNGTIHASGSGNLVLEISSAPYIFTFKMYDWLRLTIDNRPRPINIEHGLNNVRFDRAGKVVEQTLISKPCIIEQKDGYTIEHLPTHLEHFYDVHRYFIKDGMSIDIHTENRLHVWMVVEGKSVEVITASGKTQEYNYIETFIIPANAKSYTLKNTSGGNIVLIKAFVKSTYQL